VPVVTIGSRARFWDITLVDSDHHQPNRCYREPNWSIGMKARRTTLTTR